MIVRLGLSTGTCAAAAAKAAALAARGIIVDRVVVPTPIGLRVEVPVKYAKQTGECSGEAGVVKDAGDDKPNDVTHGITIVAEVRLTNNGVIEVAGGPGVGIVTQPGLPVPVGEHAINPVPRRQIVDSVREVLPPGTGAKVRIVVPEGEKIAKLTMNPELGIIGGISILGVTGLVIPYSHRAFVHAVAVHLRQLRTLGESCVVLTTGHDTRKALIEKFGVRSRLVVSAGDYLVDVLKIAEKLGFRSVLVVAKPAKALKLAVGAVNTSSEFIDARIEALVYHMLRAGLEPDKVKHAVDARSVGEVLASLSIDDVRKILLSVAEKIDIMLSKKVKEVIVKSAVFYNNELIGTQDFFKLLKLTREL